jgi:hypothetical protein
MIGASQKLDCLNWERNTPYQKQLADHSPYGCEQDEQTQKCDPPVRRPVCWQNQPQQSQDEKDYNAFYESKDHSIGYDPNRVP